jgi:tRNA G18 (ribose-2'-O)-methylase SpoU
MRRPDLRVTSRNARFQQWGAMLDNRAKRTRTGEFLIQGVRPINLAVQHGWRPRTLIYADGRQLSPWARGLLAELSDAVEQVAMAPELLAELAGKEDGSTELVVVAEQPPDDLSRITPGPDFLGVLFDRPASPGNLGTLIRSADAFGATGVVVVGHAADPYDPRAVRASTGSLFALPVVRAGSPTQVLDWLAEVRAGGVEVRLVGTDEHGEAELAAFDLTGPTLVVLGNETSGMSAAWRNACQHTVRIPIGGAASSLNAAAAGTVVLYEAARQRRPTV